MERISAILKKERKKKEGEENTNTGCERKGILKDIVLTTILDTSFTFTINPAIIKIDHWAELVAVFLTKNLGPRTSMMASKKVLTSNFSRRISMICLPSPKPKYIQRISFSSQRPLSLALIGPLTNSITFVNKVFTSDEHVPNDQGVNIHLFFFFPILVSIWRWFPLCLLRLWLKTL